MNNGYLITFEGGEGSGKSTQIKLLEEELQQYGYEVETTREPGGTEIGKKIRKLLLEPSYKNMDARTELLLYAADRVQDVEENIKPFLNEGKIVLADRYLDSTVAYQSYGRGLDRQRVEDINRWVIDNCVPDLTIILDIEVRKGLKRARSLTGNNGDRLERDVISFHQRLRRGFLEMAKNDERFVVLDAADSQQSIKRQIFKIIKERLLDE